MRGTRVISATMEEILDGRGWLVSRLLAPDECAALVAGDEGMALKAYPADEHHGSGRLCLRKTFADAGLAATLQARVLELCPREVKGWHLSGVSSNFRLIRYDAGHFCGSHVDYGNALPPDEQMARRTWLTLMVYLNEDFDGGKLTFHTEPACCVSPTLGLGCMFLQDDHELVHHADTVSRGRKYILRGDVVYQRELQDGRDYTDDNALFGDGCFDVMADTLVAADDADEPDSDSDFGP